MHSDSDDIARGLRLAAVAVVSAVVTATLVIGGGQAWLDRNGAQAASQAPDAGEASSPALVHAAY